MVGAALALIVAKFWGEALFMPGLACVALWASVRGGPLLRRRLLPLVLATTTLAIVSLAARYAQA